MDMSKKPKRLPKAVPKKQTEKPVEQVTAKPEIEPVEWDYFAMPYGHRRTQ